MQDHAQDIGSLIILLPGTVLVIVLIWFMFRSARNIKSIRNRNAQFWDKTLALQAESNQLMREILAELRERK